MGCDIMKKQIKWKNIIVLIAFLIFSTTLTISIINILKWDNDRKGISEQVKKIEEVIVIEESEDTENTEIIEQVEVIPEANPYWDYIKMNLINVDFNELKTTNEQVKGWIQVNGTNINYPFVQSIDNSYYLTHAFNKSYNQAGWIFLDYRNKIDSLDRNTIIYGHSRVDKTMFGSLKNILKSNWYNNADNHIVKLSTETENTLWQVFSVYHIPTTSDYLQIDFSNDDDYQKFLDMLTARSMLNFNTTVNYNDKILTLSTCYKKTDKMVMHAKLIKRESK